MSETALARMEPSYIADERRNKAAALMQAFLSGRSEQTVRAYRQDMEDFRSFVGTDKPEEAARYLLSRGQGEANALALAYKANLLERGLQASTVNRRLASLRSMVKMARTLGMVSWALDVENMKAESYRDTRGPGRQGFRRLADVAASRKDAKGLRDMAAIRLLHDLGLRRGEVVGLDIEDLDLENGTVAVLGKGRTQKVNLTLPEPTKAALEAWLTARGMEPGPLFISFDRAGKGDGRLTGKSLYCIVRELGEKVGLKTRPHGLRHTAITEACKAAQANGIDLEEVLDFSRHKDVKILMVYRDRERNVQGKLASLVAANV